MAASPERLDVAGSRPATKEEREHHARYCWAASILTGDVLDVACGTGYGAKLLARRARVTGVDRDADAVRLATSRVHGTFVVSDVPPIPFPDRAFDHVVCFETIEHIRNDIAFVRDIRRVLRPGGSLLISTPNQDVSAPNGVPANPWHVREYTLSGLIGLLREAGGFEVRDVREQSFPATGTALRWFAWRLHGRRLARPLVVRFGGRALFGPTRVERFHGRRRPGYWLIAAD